MAGLFGEARGYRKKKQQEAEMAVQTAAFFLICGIDLSAALAFRGEERLKICKKMKRLIERERLRGLRHHWSYDLNRHIALKQALDRLTPLAPNA